MFVNNPVRMYIPYHASAMIFAIPSLVTMCIKPTYPAHADHAGT